MSDFGGKTIVGDISRYTDGIQEQADPQLFLDALDELLDTPGVEAVRWEQHTPYFNDGEPCQFGTGEVMVSVEGLEKDEEEYDDDEDLSFYDSWELNYYHKDKYPEVFAALRKFEGQLDSQHYVVLNEKFGDPAQVTATKEGFQVEYYEHD